MYANFVQDWIPWDVKQRRLFDKNVTQNVKNTNFFLSRIHFIHELGAERTICIKCRDAIATAGLINFEVLKGEPLETVLKGGL